MIFKSSAYLSRETSLHHRWENRRTTGWCWFCLGLAGRKAAGQSPTGASGRPGLTWGRPAGAWPRLLGPGRSWRNTSGQSAFCMGTSCGFGTEETPSRCGCCDNAPFPLERRYLFENIVTSIYMNELLLFSTLDLTRRISDNFHS